MTVSAPTAYGTADYYTVSTPAQVPMEALLTMDPVAQAIETSVEQYDEQEAKASLSRENDRWLEHQQRQQQIDYVRAQQNLREVFPHFNDPQLMREQVQTLAAML